MCLASYPLGVLRDGGRRGVSFITWWTTDGTATAGSDFARLEPRVERFGAGEQNRTLHVPIIGDRNVEGSESFYVHIALGDSGRVVVGEPTPVSVRVPYRGKILFTVESDHLHESLWMSAATANSDVNWSFRINEFTPNVYVSAFLIKDPHLDSAEAFLPDRAFGELLLLALGMGTVAQVGDLCESALKRACGAKDSGHIFPGHGGSPQRQWQGLSRGASRRRDCPR